MKDIAHVRAALENVAAGVGVAERFNVVFLSVDRNDAGRWRGGLSRILRGRGRLRSHVQQHARHRDADNEGVKNDPRKDFIHINMASFAILMIPDINDNVIGCPLKDHIP